MDVDVLMFRAMAIRRLLCYVVVMSMSSGALRSSGLLLSYYVIALVLHNT